jgi:hypothetical protein
MYRIYKIGMMTMLPNSLIEQLNVNRRTCHIAMKVVSADSFCSMVWWGARVARAEAWAGSVEASKARLGFRSHGSWYIRKNKRFTKFAWEEHYGVCTLLCSIR